MVARGPRHVTKRTGDLVRRTSRSRRARNTPPTARRARTSPARAIGRERRVRSPVRVRRRLPPTAGVRSPPSANSRRDPAAGVPARGVEHVRGQRRPSVRSAGDPGAELARSASVMWVDVAERHRLRCDGLLVDARAFAATCAGVSSITPAGAAAKPGCVGCAAWQATQRCGDDRADRANAGTAARVAGASARCAPGAARSQRHAPAAATPRAGSAARRALVAQD